MCKSSKEIGRSYAYWLTQLRNPRNGIEELRFAQGALDVLDWLLGNPVDHPVPMREQEDHEHEGEPAP